MPRPWTVLPHTPLEKHEDNLWTVEAALPQGPIKRRMTVVRLGDGRLVFGNAVALDEPSMKALEAWGTPAFALAPNGFHRIDLGSFKVRYPALRIVTEPEARKKIEEIVAVDGGLEVLPADTSLSVEKLAGGKMGEPVLVVKSGPRVSLSFFGDAITNCPPLPGIGGFIAGALGFVGAPRVPRLIKWIGLRDKSALREQLLRLAELPGLSRLITAHGPVVEAGAADALRLAARQL